MSKSSDLFYYNQFNPVHTFKHAEVYGFIGENDMITTVMPCGIDSSIEINDEAIYFTPLAIEFPYSRAFSGGLKLDPGKAVVFSRDGTVNACLSKFIVSDKPPSSEDLVEGLSTFAIKTGALPIVGIAYVMDGRQLKYLLEDVLVSNTGDFLERNTPQPIKEGLAKVQEIVEGKPSYVRGLRMSDLMPLSQRIPVLQEELEAYKQGLNLTHDEILAKAAVLEEIAVSSAKAKLVFQYKRKFKSLEYIQKKVAEYLAQPDSIEETMLEDQAFMRASTLVSETMHELPSYLLFKVSEEVEASMEVVLSRVSQEAVAEGDNYIEVILKVIKVRLGEMAKYYNDTYGEGYCNEDFIELVYEKVKEICGELEETLD